LLHSLLKVVAQGVVKSKVVQLLFLVPLVVLAVVVLQIQD
jgi:hypothetical protein